MIDLSGIPIVSDLPGDVREWVIRGLVALIIFGIVLMMRRLLTRLLVAPFRAMSDRSETELDNTLLNILEPASSYFVVAAGLLLGAQVLSVDNFELIFITRLARSLIIVGVMVALFQAIDMLNAQSRLVSITGLTIDRELMPFIRTGLKIILGAVAIVIVIQEWGYNVNGLIAGLGLGGLAFSLAAQETVANLFGFSTIVADRPFTVGEYISTPDVEGTVERVGVRSTRIRTLDQSLMVVPNSKLAGSVITNWSRLSYRRFNFTLGITYDASPAQMQDLVQHLRDMLNEREAVQKDSITVLFTEFGSSSLDVLVRCNVNLQDWTEWMQERQYVNLEIMSIIESMGLGMAFPSRTVYIEQAANSEPAYIPTRPSRQKPQDETYMANNPTASGSQQDEAGDSPSSGV